MGFKATHKLYVLRYFSSYLIECANKTVFFCFQSESIRWTLSGNQQNVWRFAQFPLPLQFNTNFHVVFEAIRGSGYKGDIAIDDIQFSTGSCSILPIYANPSPTTTPGTIATTVFTRPPTIPPGTYNCDFEKDFCQYTQVNSFCTVLNVSILVFYYTRTDQGRQMVRS